MSDFADSLEDSTEKRVKSGEKKKKKNNSKESQDKKIPSSHVAGFFHPSNSKLHHDSYSRELDFIGSHLRRCGVSLSLDIADKTKTQPTAR